jgi:hypothetical protein
MIPRLSAEGAHSIRWMNYDLCPPVLKQAGPAFKDGLSVRDDVGDDQVRVNGHVPASWIASN